VNFELFPDLDAPNVLRFKQRTLTYGEIVNAIAEREPATLIDLRIVLTRLQREQIDVVNLEGRSTICGFPFTVLR
jgi:hypothetical protein